MAEKRTAAQVAKSRQTRKHDQDDPAGKAADSAPEPVAVDRPGFDLGGSTGKTSAGTGLGLGQDAAESRRDRRLPGRRGKKT